MRRVIQRTITTTKIISLTITHSESEEAVEYMLTDGADQINTPEPLLPRQAATATTIKSESVQPDVESPDATGDTPVAHEE